MAGELFQDVTQLGKETTYGTAVAATRIAYCNGMPVLTRTRASRPRQLADGTRHNQRAATLGPTEVGGTFEIPLSASEILEWLLITLQGGVTPTTPTGAVNGRLWTFVGGASAVDSATIEYHDGAAPYRGYGIYGNELKISGDANGVQSASVTVFGLEREAHALTGSLTQRVPTIHEGFETLAFIDAFSASFGVKQIPNWLQKWEITYSNNLQRKYLANNRNRMAFPVLTPMSLKAALTIEAAAGQSTTELANWDAVTRRGLELRFGYNSNNPISGDTAINEAQTLTKGGTWSAGTYTLSVLGQVTSALAFDAVAATIQTAINTALLPLGAGYTVGVTGGPLSTTPVVVTFSGTEVAGKNVPMIVGDITLVTGSSPTLAIVQTTPGYEANEGITLDIPGFWESADLSQTDAGTRMYAMSLDYLYDPTNATPFTVKALCGRATAF